MADDAHISKDVPGPAGLFFIVGIGFSFVFWFGILVVCFVIDVISGQASGDGQAIAWGMGPGGYLTALLISSSIGAWLAVENARQTEVFAHGCPNVGCRPRSVRVMRTEPTMKWYCEQCRITWVIGGTHWNNERRIQHHSWYEVKTCEQCKAGRSFYVAYHANHDRTEECRACGYRKQHNHFDLI